jgi:hypothetical protein
VSTSVNADRITNDTTIGAAIQRIDCDPADAVEEGPCFGPEPAERSFKERRF